MKRLTIVILSFIIMILTCSAQELTIKSMNAAPFDLSAASKPVNDYNGNACGLVKVRLVSPGAVFGGNVMQPVEYKTGEYWVYMTAGSHLLQIKHPNFLPLDIDFRDYGIRRVESNCTYILTLVMPNGGQTNTDDGMRYLVMHVKPENATVYIDDKLQSVANGSVSVRLPRGNHTYRVEAVGFAQQTGTVELAEGRKTMDIDLESAKAEVTVSCPTPSVQIYVNDGLVGPSPWSGQLVAGNYLIEGRLEGYKPQQQSVTLAENENRTIELPDLNAIIGNLEVNYQPTDAEVWIDGKKAGVSPDIFRNIIVGDHLIEVRASGYKTLKQTVTIKDGETVQLNGELPSGYSATGILIPEAVDLGLSVKWAPFYLGATKPEEQGYYYKWGETTPSDDKGWETYKYAKGSYDKITKYCTDSKYGYNGFTDGKTTLEPMDDAATVNLGGSWRMPTSEEAKELKDKCHFDNDYVNGIHGIRVTGPNGNSIFFPVFWQSVYMDGIFYGVSSGGDYWADIPTSSLDQRELCISAYKGRFMRNSARGYSLQVRPVLAE